MTTFQIDSNDKSTIEQIKKFVKDTLHFEIKVIKPTSQTKWEEFAHKMDGLYSLEIVEHLQKSRKEARDNFVANL